MKSDKLNIAIIVILCLILVRTCTISTSKVEKNLVKVEQRLDSIQRVMVNKKDLQIEGLLNEKRMIQSTDRKILDVQRQSEIDKEIDKLIKQKQNEN